MPLIAHPSGLPPSPPHSTEGEPHIVKVLEGCSIYPPDPVWNTASSGVEYVKIHGDDFSSPEPQSIVSSGVYWTSVRGDILMVLRYTPLRILVTNLQATILRLYQHPIQ